MSLLCMLRRSLCIHLYPTPVDNVATVQPAGVPFWVMWQLEKDTSHEPDGFEYPNGGRGFGRPVKRV